MQPARHPEAPERKQSQQSDPPQLLGKMTNRKQDAGVTLSRSGSILQHLLIHLFTLTNGICKKAGGPGVATRARVEGE